MHSCAHINMLYIYNATVLHAYVSKLDVQCACRMVSGPKALCVVYVSGEWLSSVVEWMCPSMLRINSIA